MSRVETPWEMFPYLVTGKFTRDGNYHTWRSKGTGDYLLIFTLAGQGRFGYIGGEMIAAPPDITLIAPGTLHDYGVEPTLRHWELLWAHFHPRPHWQSWLVWPEVAPGLMRLRPDPETAAQTIRRMHDVNALATGASSQRDLYAMNALEEVLLHCNAINPLVSQSPIDARVQSAMEFFCQNLSRAVRLEEAAEAAGLSPSRLAHLFREQAGTTPQRFLEQHRLDRAVQLLETTQLSVKEISQQVGFADPFYFTLRFKQHFGVSPRQYRQNLPRFNQPGVET